MHEAGARGGEVELTARQVMTRRLLVATCHRPAKDQQSGQ